MSVLMPNVMVWRAEEGAQRRVASVAQQPAASGHQSRLAAWHFEQSVSPLTTAELQR
jgi:hypothetical protein